MGSAFLWVMEFLSYIFPKNAFANWASFEFLIVQTSLLYLCVTGKLFFCLLSHVVRREAQSQIPNIGDEVGRE